MTEQPTSAYPLTWPAGWQRTEDYSRKDGRFSSFGKRVTIAVAVERVQSALMMMGVHWDDIVISTDLMLRADGLPRSRQSTPNDPGAAVYWTTREGDKRCMAIDLYERIADNIAAVAATLEAMRAIKRHGGGEILDRAFTGFKALPNPADEPWWSVLDYYDESDALAHDFESRARRRLSMVSADQGTGDDWMFQKIKKALDKGREVAKAAQ